MEERLIDKEDERLIRIKKKAEGVDAEDVLAQEGEESENEEEVLVTLPDDYDENYDEDLVGLTPTELKRELARRKKIEEEERAECEKLVAAAKEELESGKFERAAGLYAQAACYPFADETVIEGLWTARTKNFTDTAPFYETDNAEEFSAASDGVKKLVREKLGERLFKEREALKKEEEELAPVVALKQEERKIAFADNRKYYAVRLLAFVGLLVLFTIAAIVSATFLVRTQSIAPVVLTAVFGGLALVCFTTSLVFLLKYLGANKLCRMNNKLSSTEEGAHLVQLREKLECLELVLED